LLFLFVFCLFVLRLNAVRVQLKEGFAEGKDLVVTVMSAMGEEQIAALKDIGHKN
jgi:translation initiation factor 5A